MSEIGAESSQYQIKKFRRLMELVNSEVQEGQIPGQLVVSSSHWDVNNTYSPPAEASSVSTYLPTAEASVNDTYPPSATETVNSHAPSTAEVSSHHWVNTTYLPTAEASFQHGVDDTYPPSTTEATVTSHPPSAAEVVDIQKLAAEMGSNCITSYKLDALKAVCRIESDDLATSQIPDDVNGVGTDLSLALRLSF